MDTFHRVAKNFLFFSTTKRKKITPPPSFSLAEDGSLGRSFYWSKRRGKKITSTEALAARPVVALRVFHVNSK
jgi:hypothetical protein